jgi:hypothetical protein
MGTKKAEVKQVAQVNTRIFGQARSAYKGANWRDETSRDVSSEFRVGVFDVIHDMLQGATERSGGVTKKELLSACLKAFPGRPAKSLACTIGRLPSGLVGRDGGWDVRVCVRKDGTRGYYIVGDRLPKSERAKLKSGAKTAPPVKKRTPAKK